jgi:hypothetical protein
VKHIHLDGTLRVRDATLIKNKDQQAHYRRTWAF